MKRQGVEGFTWDSDAEEWHDWCWSVLVNDPPRTVAGQNRIWRMIGEYQLEYGQTNALEARHSPAQRDLTHQPYLPPTRRKTPSYGAVIGVCGLVLVAVAFWIWG